MKVNKDFEIAVELVKRLRAKKEVVRLEALSVEMTESLHFMEQIARKLRIAGILASVRGPGGGYHLASQGPVSLRKISYAIGDRPTMSTTSQSINALGLMIENAYESITV